MCASNAALVDVDPARPLLLLLPFFSFGSVGQNTHKDNQYCYSGNAKWRALVENASHKL
jgi:hypothetical protein